ncbi:unnamed protein product [Rhizoctonia solani]|uniref:DUF6535 domain-containing protein n=1 Tax=Rhizoctonia solani TaxID=456999 RepID=A0A8H3GYM0_9AGAM|nr:unnamed protein product [Rhizoctonia solani]
MEEALSRNHKKSNAAQNALRFLKRDSPTLTDGNKAGANATQEGERMYTRPSAKMRPRPFDQMGPDRFGEELAPDAAIWNIYLDEAQDRDRELVEGRQRSLDTLLLFAALFSAILTAFLIESKDLLQQDPADASAALLLFIAQSQQRIELGLPAPEELPRSVAIAEFTPSVSARWVNGIWFMSLGLSLSAALIAMLGKEWLTTFLSSRPRSTRRLAFIRQSRLKGLEDWGALHIIALLPTLLHLSLLLFSVGLVIYLWALDAALAAVISGIIGVTLAFYFVTGILGAIFEFCPFVTEVSEYTQRAVAALFRLPSRNLNGESSAPSVKDLTALVWLSEHAGDPIAVDYAYQAIAGLHRSPYVELDSARPIPHSSPATAEVALLGQDVTINSLLLKVVGRFDDLLVGSLETGGMEPPVCRYINAIIALGTYTAPSTPSPLDHWLEILDIINKVWSSSLQQSMSGSSFAGVLIAEMDVLKLVDDLIWPIFERKYSIGEKVALVELAVSMETSSPNTNPQDQQAIEILPETDQTTSAILPRLSSRLAIWLEVSLTLLQSHAKGETNIDRYLVDGLFRATSYGAKYLQRIHLILSSENPIGSTLGAGENSLDCLRILISIFSQPHDSSLGSIMQLTEGLKAYSYIASMILTNPTQPIRSNFDRAFNFRNLNLDPPSSRREIMWVSVRYMMLTASYLSDSIPELPKRRQVFEDALKLIFTFSIEDIESYPDYIGARQAIQCHLGDYIRILEFLDASESNLNLVNKSTCNYLCMFAYFIVYDSSLDVGMYIPPSSYRTLMRLFSRSLLTVNASRYFMDTVLQRLRTPSVSLDTLPPQSSAIPEPRSPIEYLQQITRYSHSFSALARSGTISNDYVNSVTQGIAEITVIAANMDSALAVESVELRAPAVPGFLEALSWVLPHLSSRDDLKDLYRRFIVAASVLLIVASKDPESKELIVNHSGRREVREILQDQKDTFIGMIPQDEWKHLVDNLALEPEDTNSDSKSEKADLDEVSGSDSEEALDADNTEQDR